MSPGGLELPVTPALFLALLLPGRVRTSAFSSGARRFGNNAAGRTSAEKQDKPHIPFLQLVACTLRLPVLDSADFEVRLRKGKSVAIARMTHVLTTESPGKGTCGHRVGKAHPSSSSRRIALALGCLLEEGPHVTSHLGSRKCNFAPSGDSTSCAYPIKRGNRAVWCFFIWK